MSENEKRGPRIPDGNPARSSRVSGEQAKRETDQKASHGKHTAAVAIDVLLLGWMFAKSIFSKAPAGNGISAPPLNVPRPAAPDRRAVPVRDGTPDIVVGPIPAAVLIAPPPRIPEKTGRSADRNLEPESGSRRRWGTGFVLCAFALGIAAGVGFLFSYWSGANTLLLGGTLSVFLGAFGVALVLYSHLLMPHTEATAPREQLPSSTGQRDAALDDYCAGVRGVQRRSLLKWGGAAGTGLLASIVISLMRSLGMSPYPALFTTVWKRGERLMTSGGQPISVDSLEHGSTITVFPESSVGSERAQTVLIRVKEQLLQLSSDRAGWAPMGYVAYSRVCTHAGCPVALFEADTNQLLCPCHQSTFDVLSGARPTGGPAARPLPQLPLYMDSDGILRAAGGFTAPPGPGFSGM